MNVLEEYYVDDIARLLGCNEKTVRRSLHEALDQLSRILLACGLLEELPSVTGGRRSCQEGKKRDFDVSNSNEGENKVRRNVQSPPSDLIS